MTRVSNLGDPARRVWVEGMGTYANVALATCMPEAWPVSNVTGSALAPGTTVAGYRIEALIGRGGMGTVYRAEETGHGRKVALKDFGLTKRTGSRVCLPGAGLPERPHDRGRIRAHRYGCARGARADHPRAERGSEPDSGAGQRGLWMSTQASIAFVGGSAWSVCESGWSPIQ